MRIAAMGGLLLLAGCGNVLSPDQQAAADERDIAMVEKANLGSGVPISPQPILLPDMEANSLFGTGCAFVAKNAGLGAVMLARMDAAYMKLDDTVVAFAADHGSEALPYDVRGKYTGKRHALQLTFTSDVTHRTGTSAGDFDGRLRVDDAKGHIVYDEPGSIQCGN